MKRVFVLFSVLAVLAIVGVAIVIFRSGPRPTADERKQMDVLTGQSFVIWEEYHNRGFSKQQEVKPFRTIAEFDGQHRAIPWLRFVASRFERYGWPKDRPVVVEFQDDRVVVTWSVPRHLRQESDAKSCGEEHIAIINTNDMSVVFLPEWPDDQ